MSDPSKEPRTLSELAEAIRYHISDDHRTPSTAHVYLLRRVDGVLPQLVAVIEAVQEWDDAHRPIGKMTGLLDNIVLMSKTLEL